MLPSVSFSCTQLTVFQIGFYPYFDAFSWGTVLELKDGNDRLAQSLDSSVIPENRSESRDSTAERPLQGHEGFVECSASQLICALPRHAAGKLIISRCHLW